MILAGGQSRRMGGKDKAGLRFGPESLLSLAVRNLRQVARPVVISLAPQQALDPAVNAADVRLVRDKRAYGGPLPGLLLGFRALAGQSPVPDAVLVMPVDLPFYTAAWMRRALEGLPGHAACLYRYEGFTNALVGAYDLRLVEKLERLAGQPKARPLGLAEGEPTRVLELETLWRPEDGPPPLMDTDTPEDYRMALALAGMGHPEGVAVTVELPGVGTMPGEQPLLARKGGDVASALARLFPMALAGSALGLARPDLVRLRPDGSAEPLQDDTPLESGDVVRWQSRFTGS